MNEPSSAILPLAAEIVAAYVGNSTVATSELPNLITTVLKALNTVGQVEAPVAGKPQPAVPVRKSIAQDYLVCLEDGRKLKMLKRYLQTRYNLTPAEYRQRWGLPHDYPMVAPAYAEQRSSLAKQIGLGRKPALQPEPEPVPELAATPAAPKRRVAGRRKAA